MNVMMIAKIAHEVNRAYCEFLGDGTQLVWDDAPDWQKESAIEGVQFHIDNPEALPRDSHGKWLEGKTRDGWVYGDVKNSDKKTHPCMVEFEALPKEQQAKDWLFRGVVHACAD